MSRLEEIRARLAERGTLVGSLAFAQHAPADLAWLLSEVERLTRERDGAERGVLALGARIDEVRTARDAATAAERERCARVCEEVAGHARPRTRVWSTGLDCAAAIRRGGE